MLLPRLHLAIEHNYKCFVGHPLCQQVFQQSFHQGMPWHGKSLGFQILHSLMQFLFAPLMVFMWTFFKLGKDISHSRGIDKNDPSLYGIKKWKTKDPSLPRRCFNKIIDYSVQKQPKLDVPVNRLIIFTGYYILFVIGLAYVVWDKSLDGNSYCFGKWQQVLTVFAISMIWQDLITFWNVRSIWTFFKFWRMYDLALHISLALTLIFRGAKVLTATNCSGCTFATCENATTTMVTNSSIVELLDDYEDGFMSFASILAICRYV